MTEQAFHLGMKVERWEDLGTATAYTTELVYATSTGAIFYHGGTHRYVLWRRWPHNGGKVKGIGSGALARLPSLVVIGLNPSTADETTNDPTVARCINYAKRWGYGGLVMLNLFGLRSTDPKGLYDHPNPVGIGHNDWLRLMAQAGDGSVVAAWGNHGRFHGRDEEVASMLEREGVRIMALGINKTGTPKHPLYLKRDQTCVRWR